APRAARGGRAAARRLVLHARPHGPVVQDADRDRCPFTRASSGAAPAGGRRARGPRVMNRVAKRALDLTLSGIGLIVSSPLWLAIATAIKIDSRGPVFYGQQRVGEG